MVTSSNFSCKRKTSSRQSRNVLKSIKSKFQRGNHLRKNIMKMFIQKNKGKLRHSGVKLIEGDVLLTRVIEDLQGLIIAAYNVNKMCG